METKKKYTEVKAELLRFDVKDIITLSGFVGEELSFLTKGTK